MAHTVLVADDSKTIRRVAEIVFAQQGDYRLITATSGEEAIVKAREVKPDLVLADHNMPGKDGYEVARALVPEGLQVVLMTGSSAPYDEGKAMNAGVKERIEKPFDCQSILEKVAALVGAPAPAPAPGLRPVGSAPLSAAVTATQKYAPNAVSSSPAIQVAPTAPAAPAVPQAQPAPSAQSATPATPAEPASQPSGWTAGSASGALGSFSGADNNAVDNLGGAVAKAAAPAVAAAVSSSSAAGDASPEAITAATREIIERVVWEVVPELAETLIREEIQRLLGR